MEKIAFYGKGGIGKSTIAAGVSMALASAGKRVLHVGCDPKHDSTTTLVKGKKVKTVIDMIFSRGVGELRRDDLIMEGKLGIDCVESGGPEPGVGCGGRAISRMFEVFEQIDLVDSEKYDVAIFDVLGDVVCGGFAAPLRASIAPKVAIVVSEEMMAGYAANNISRAVDHYLDNGACLAGLVLNIRDNKSDKNPIVRLAKAINTRILVQVPRTPKILEGELRRQSVMEYAPKTKAARNVDKLARMLLDLKPSDCMKPRPVELEDVREIMLGQGS